MTDIGSIIGNFRTRRFIDLVRTMRDDPDAVSLEEWNFVDAYWADASPGEAAEAFEGASRLEALLAEEDEG